MNRRTKELTVICRLAGMLAFVSVLLTGFARGEVIKIMTANLPSGPWPNEYYYDESTHLFQGLEPDIIFIQEFNVPGTQTRREYVDTAFGSDFDMYIGSGNIPNAIVSRYPIISSGEWEDTQPTITDRTFVWAVIDIPGTVDLQGVSVHLKASSGPTNRDMRTDEAEQIRDYVQSNFDDSGYIIVVGDLNTYPSPTEPCLSIFASFLDYDDHTPVDRNGNYYTNATTPRKYRYDWIMPNQVLDEFHATLHVGTGFQAFTDGIVFDSTVFTPLSEVPPIVSGDSYPYGMHHMPVMKAFNIPGIDQVIDSGDYDGDGTSDIAVFRPSAGLWSIRGVSRAYFGVSNDLPVPGDYNGDGTTDIGLFRGSSGLWAIRGVSRLYYGSSSDIPVPGDYDGDGSTDPGIFRDTSGLWSIRGVSRVYFGADGDIPAPGDYDGDGTRDLGVFRGSIGLWAIRDVSRAYFGTEGDEAVPGDYDGNGTWACAIYRSSSGLWAIRNVFRVYFGSGTHQAVPADYDGDATDDVAVFKGESGVWAARQATRAYYGTSGDIPVTR